MHWFIDPIRNHYADFNGRASRKEYWMFSLLCGIIVIFIAFAIGMSSVFFDEWLFIVCIVLLMIGALAITIPSVALQVRRIHDIGFSGWWYLLCLIPYIGGIIIFIMSILPSEVGTNKYGPNPYGIGNVSGTSQPTEQMNPNP